MDEEQPRAQSVAKQIRLSRLREWILVNGRVPRAGEIHEYLSVSESQARKDIREIADEIPTITTQAMWDILRDRLNERLRDTKNPLSDKRLVDLLEFFLAKKRETHLDSTTTLRFTKKRGEDIEELLEQYAGIFEEDEDGDGEDEGEAET